MRGMRFEETTPDVTNVTNGSSEQITAGTALPHACEIWVLTKQGSAESGLITTAIVYGLARLSRHY